MDLKARMRNKTFWVALSSAIIVLVQQMGFDIFPSNISDIVNSILLIATILGVFVDTSTPGINDNK